MGECILGAAAAGALGLGPGDALLTSPSTLFDLAGVYPLKLHVVGVLEPSYGPDDEAVFVDVRTAWVAEGLGHGHQDLGSAGPDVVLKRKEGTVTANAKLVQYNEITESNVDSFHFHGDPSSYPVSAAIVVPHDEKSGVLLRGRFVDAETTAARPSCSSGGLVEQADLSLRARLGNRRLDRGLGDCRHVCLGDGALLEASGRRAPHHDAARVQPVEGCSDHGLGDRRSWSALAS